MAAVSNGALITRDGKFGMLKLWIDGAQRAGVKNFMVIAIDDDVSALVCCCGARRRQGGDRREEGGGGRVWSRVSGGRGQGGGGRVKLGFWVTLAVGGGGGEGGRVKWGSGSPLPWASSRLSRGRGRSLALKCAL